LIPASHFLPPWYWSAHELKHRIVFEFTNPNGLRFPGMENAAKSHLNTSKGTEIYRKAAEVIGSAFLIHGMDALKPIPLGHHINQILQTRNMPMHRKTLEDLSTSLALSHGLIIDELEPFEEAAPIASLPECESCGLDFLEQSIRGAFADEFPRMFYAWQRRNLVEIEAIFCHHKNLFPHMVKASLCDRNRKWTDNPLRFLSQQTIPTLFMVGALHCVGENSFLECLRRNGVEITEAP